MRWKRIFLRMDQRSKTTSHSKRYSNTVWHGELCSDRGSCLVSEFLQFSLFNINDTFKTWDWSSSFFLKLVYFTNHNCVKRQWDSSTGRSEWDRFPSITCVKFTCWTNRTGRPVDQANQWMQSYPCKTKTSQETQRSLQKFLEPDRKPKVIYTDNSLEFGKGCEDLFRNHCTSTPHRSETSGIAERAVRRVKEGTSAVLSPIRSGWKLVADSMECKTYLRNVPDLLSDGKTPHERRFGKTCKGPIIPFGSLVEYYPISAKDQSRIHQFGKKILPGLFLGYALYAGRIWRGDILVADIEELENLDASEIHA